MLKIFKGVLHILMLVVGLIKGLLCHGRDRRGSYGVQIFQKKRDKVYHTYNKGRKARPAKEYAHEGKELINGALRQGGVLDAIPQYLPEPDS